MSRAAFFDLDGTLLTVNSAALWIRRERRLGRIRRRHALKAAGYFAAYKLGVLDIERAMDEAAASIAGEQESALRAATRDWWHGEVVQHVSPGGIDVIARHRAAGDRLVLLTSSSPYASECAVERFGLDGYLSTRFEVRDGRMTGRVERPICYGAGKVTLAERYAREHGIRLEESAFYTDSTTDVPMLERVGSPYAVHPDTRLRLTALRRGWPVLNWR